MKKRQWVVRVVQTYTPQGDPINEGGIIDGSFLESLRFAGLIVIHEFEEYDSTRRCFDIRCPHGLDSKTWAEMNAERMQSFGYNAVAAPSTE